VETNRTVPAGLRPLAEFAERTGMRPKAIPAGAEDLGAKGFINRFSIGRRLALCFVGIFVLLLAVNGILLWQFHSAQSRADRRLTGVSLELIAALKFQSSLQAFNDRLNRVAQSQDAVLLRQESGSLRDMILDSVQNARLAITQLPPEVRLYPTFVPTIEVIESTLPSQLESLNSLAASGDWSALRLRLANEKRPLDAETSMLVKSITRELNDQLGQTVTNIARLQRQMVIVLPLTALGALLIAGLVGLIITRSITTPLGRLVESSSALSRGEFDHVVPISGQDELARLGRVFNDTAGKLRSLYETLQESKAKLEEAQRIAHVGYWEWDLATNRVIWSDETYRIYGLQPQEHPMDLATVREKIHPEDWGGVFRALEEALSGGARYAAECRVFRPTGEVRIVHSQGYVRRDTSGRPTLMFGTVQDISDRKRAEKALQQSQFYLNEGQHLAHMGSWAFNPTGFTYWSSALFQLHGLDPHGKPPTIEEYLALVHPEDRDTMEQEIQKMLVDHRQFDFTKRIVRPDGNIRYVRCVGVPVTEGTTFKGFMGTGIDVTEEEVLEQERERIRQLETELAHTNRVSMLGEMAASLAHEIKQPIAAAITSANTCIEWLAHEPPNVDRARAAAARIDKYGNRAAEIIDRIRSLYRKSPPQRELVDVNGIIQEMLTLLKGEATRYPIAVRAELTAGLPKIMADRVQLQQVFMNLVLNAIEAMKDSGGELTVKSQLQDGQLQFSVSDTGLGLPKEKAMMEQIFSAFYTTKPQGSGMGLAISRSIVESHGGRLWATANKGRGATFQFTLPTQVMESALVV
jgi:PAS domain S-box-containing protein